MICTLHIAHPARPLKGIASANMHTCNVQSVMNFLIFPFGETNDVTAFCEFRKVVFDRTFAQPESFTYGDCLASLKFVSRAFTNSALAPLSLF